jgi:hypothetical protein
MSLRLLPLTGAVLTLLVLAIPAPGLAQDASAQARHATLSLSANFTPDPQTIATSTGGDVDTSALAPECDGLIGTAPDVVLTYTAATAPLALSVSSAADTSLVVNAPDGSWFCSTGSALLFGRPQSGRYAIWIASPTPATNATLTLSSAGPD